MPHRSESMRWFRGWFFGTIVVRNETPDLRAEEHFVARFVARKMQCVVVPYLRIGSSSAGHACVALLLVGAAVVAVELLRQKWGLGCRRGLLWRRRDSSGRISMEELSKFDKKPDSAELVKRLAMQDAAELRQLLLLTSFQNCVHVARSLLPLLEMQENNNEAFRGALLVASGNGSTEVVNLLLENGCGDVKARSSHGNTPLIYAASKGHFEVCKRLLEEPKSREVINEQNIFKRTALSAAAENGFFNVVDMLVNIAEVNAASNDNQALRGAALARHDRIVLRILQSKNSARLAVQPCPRLAAYLELAAREELRKSLAVSKSSYLRGITSNVRTKIIALAFGNGVILLGDRSLVSIERFMYEFHYGRNPASEEP